MWQAAVSDTMFQPLHPQVQTNRWKWISVNQGLTKQAALLPLTLYRGQAAGADGEHAQKASTFPHQKSMGWMDVECQKRVFSGFWN